MPPSREWLLWQLVDSAFPTGGFAHSGGLEAAWQQGAVERSSLARWVAEALDHAASGALPLLGGVHADPSRFDELTLLADASLSNHVANRASRAQGAALVATAAASFAVPSIVELRARTRREPVPLHLAPAFGFVSQALGLTRDEAARLFVFQTLRTFTSSAVRLGAIGPLEAQALQHGLSSAAEGCVVRHAESAPEDLAQTSPLLELAQAHQDRLYSRLFSS